EIEKMERLLDRLGALSRPGERPHHPIDLRAPLGDAIEAMRPVFAEKSVVLSAATGQSPCTILGDQSELEQLFLNLLMNAHEVTAPGGMVRVEVATTADRAIVAVVDTGPGVPPELLERVFEPFFSTKERGSGLGEHSVFTAPNDAEALKTLRLIEIDVVVRGGVGMPRDVESFVARVRAIAPSALTVVIAATAQDAEVADFALPLTFTQRELDGMLRRVIDKLRLTREITALRSSLAPEVPGTAAGPDEPWEGAAFARVLKEFTRAFAAGFDLPRALEMFLDAIGELVRPTRMALLL